MTPRRPLSLADIGRRVALTDDDLAVLERFRSLRMVGSEAWSQYPDEPWRDDIVADGEAAIHLYDYLLNGEPNE